MLFQGIFTLLLLIGGIWMIWKFLIFPRIPDEPEIPEYKKILEDKLEKLQVMRDEHESIKTEMEVTQELESLDLQIEKTIRQIKDIEK